MEMSCSSKLIPAQSSATSEMIGGVKRVIRESGDPSTDWGIFLLWQTVLQIRL